MLLKFPGSWKQREVLELLGQGHCVISALLGLRLKCGCTGIKNGFPWRLSSGAKYS
jgi:hypothetical protein